MSVLLKSCFLTTACLVKKKKRKKDPFPVSESYFCSTRMCFWSCLACIMCYSKCNISHCQCSFWTKLSVSQKKVVTTTAEKYWTLFSKIKILSKYTALGLMWCGEASKEVLSHVFYQFLVTLEPFVFSGFCGIWCLRKNLF